MKRPNNLTLNKICNLTQNLHIQWDKYAHYDEDVTLTHKRRADVISALIDELYAITVRIKID